MHRLHEIPADLEGVETVRRILVEPDDDVIENVYTRLPLRRRKGPLHRPGVDLTMKPPVWTQELDEQGVVLINRSEGTPSQIDRDEIARFREVDAGLGLEKQDLILELGDTHSRWEYGNLLQRAERGRRGQPATMDSRQMTPAVDPAHHQQILAFTNWRLDRMHRSHRRRPGR